MLMFLSLVGFIVFVYGVVKVIKDVVKKSESKKRSLIIMFAGLFSFILFAGVFGESDADADDNKDTEETKEEKYENNDYKTDLEGKVVDAITDAGVEVNKDAMGFGSNSTDEGFVLVNLDAGENLTANMTKGGIYMDTLDVLEAVSDISDLDKLDIQWVLPLTDDYGKEEDGKVMSMSFSKDTIDKIDFDGINKDNVPDIADEYKEYANFE